MSETLPEIVRVESTRRQRTLARRVDVAGFGFWTSRDVVFSFLPAAENSGVRFFRTDLPNAAPIPALVEYRVDKPRQTSLAFGDARVDMIEHALAALRGAGIDNCDVLADAPEAPGFDGSGAPFFNAFQEAGTVEQTAERIRLKVAEPVRFGDETASIDVAPPKAGESALDATNGRLTFEYRLEYDVPRSIPNQTARFEFSFDSFGREIAPARTFLTLEEANQLRELGICKRVGPKDVLIFGENGPIDNASRFENECARHKVLDAIGDFALAPFDWEGEFRLRKTGHAQNAAALARLLTAYRRRTV